MNNTHADGNLTSNNNSEMLDELDDCIDKKAWGNETVISAGFINEKPCDTGNKQGNIYNYVCIKDENIDNLAVVVGETNVLTDCTDDKICLNETVISGGYIKEEPCDIRNGSIQNHPSVNEENIDDLTELAQDIELMTNCIDNKVCVYETIISGGYIKEEPGDMEDELEGITHNNVAMKGCEECGEKYDLYCLKCSTLIRIFDSNNPDGRDNTVRQTLPKNFIDICETQSGVGIVALRIIPKGVVFGPFRGLESTEDDTVSKWKLKNMELVYTKDPGWLNWMQYIRMADQSSRQNLVSFQYEGGLYYHSECHINVGDELLVRCDSKSEIQDMEDSYWEPLVCERLDDSYACTFCCVGYKSISHLKAHNSTCIEKRNRKDFCKEIMQCDICKIYLDKKEYADYHLDRCCKSNGKCVSNSRCRRNRRGSLRYRIHNSDRPFSCTHCSYKATTKGNLKQHVAIHNDDKPFACTFCSYKTTRKSFLNEHVANHNDDKPFACTLCPYNTTTKGNLKLHIVVHNDDRPFACPLCSYKAKKTWYLKQHLLTHNDDRPFACTLCPYKTKIQQLLKQHMAVHYDDRPFPCSLCPYKATINSNLKKHVALHNADKRFACTQCPHKTTTSALLKKHVGIHDKAFGCTLCPYKTTSKSILKQHMAVHSDDRPFGCSLCLYKANTNSVLKRHMATHSDDRPFACALCPYKAKMQSNLKQHILTHNDDRPFACTLCPYKAKRQEVLKLHMAVHNDNRPFLCSVCPYKATTNSKLKQHVALHNKDRRFPCFLCPYKATTNSQLKQHVAIHNDDKAFGCILCPYKTTRKSILKLHMAVHSDDRPFGCSLCSYKANTSLALKRHITSHSDNRPFACALCPYKATTSSNLKRRVTNHNEC